MISSTTCRNGRVRVGSPVRYSAEFCRSVGAFTGDMAHAFGRVTKLVPLGETILAEIDWDRGPLPKRVNCRNLVLSGVPENV